jgi:hypothetical protein
MKIFTELRGIVCGEIHIAMQGVNLSSLGGSVPNIREKGD